MEENGFSDLFWAEVERALRADVNYKVKSLLLRGKSWVGPVVESPDQ